MILAFLLAACGGAPQSRDAPPAPDDRPAALLLARHPERLEALELPDTNRPGGAPPPEEVPLRGPFELVRTVGGVGTWRTPLPFRPRGMFLSSAPPGMEVRTTDGRTFRFMDGYRGDRTPHTWDWTHTDLLLRLGPDESPPEPGALVARFPRGRQREAELNRATSSRKGRDFAFRSMQVGFDTFTGLYLPAPGRAAFRAPVPPGARLAFRAMILPPEQAEGAASDGAAIEVRLEDGEVLVRRELSVGAWTDVDLPVPSADGAERTITFLSDPVGQPTLDYVFLAEPTLYVPDPHPRRFLLVFVDTLRPDHMGVYGYERPTTPHLDALAAEGAVFTQARSVAPWTLPSARTALTGAQPELWSSTEHLPDRLARAGWATGAFTGNVYLSSSFDMADGWTRHRSVKWPLAEEQADAVRAFFARQEGRDAFALLHLMDVHLPYEEPRPWRHLWAADEPPEGLPERILRRDVMRVARGDRREAVRRYLVDRYDQSLRYVDEVLGELIEELGPEVPVVLFADHGEEFWEHGDFEHGHTLYDELLRVPLIVRAPGVPPGRFDTPVSLLDLAPTLYDLLGIVPPEGVEGASLLPLARGDEGARQELAARDQAFGRPLYGRERWGVLSGSVKYTTYKGREEVYDLAADPAERHPIRPDPDRLDDLRARVGRAMGTWSGIVLRLDPGYLSAAPPEDVTLTLRLPGGIGAAWLGGDPLLISDTRLRHEADGTVTVVLGKGKRGSKEIYLRPASGSPDPDGLEVVVRRGEREEVHVVHAPQPPPVGSPYLIDSWRAAGRTFRLTWAVRPIPRDRAEAIEAYDPEVATALKALGYVE